MSMNLLAFDEETIPEELEEVGSYNHSYIQVDLTLRLLQAGAFTVLPELSLDTSSITNEMLRSAFKIELKPDLAVYPARPKPTYDDDILRMTEMPLLVVEILSPTQSLYTLSRKVKAYFALGVRSCWIVLPAVKGITIYKSPTESTTYNKGEVAVDDNVGIEIAISDIF